MTESSQQVAQRKGVYLLMLAVALFGAVVTFSWQSFRPYFRYIVFQSGVYGPMRAGRYQISMVDGWFVNWDGGAEKPPVLGPAFAPVHTVSLAKLEHWWRGPVNEFTISDHGGDSATSCDVTTSQGQTQSRIVFSWGAATFADETVPVAVLPEYCLTVASTLHDSKKLKQALAEIRSIEPLVAK